MTEPVSIPRQCQRRGICWFSLCLSLISCLTLLGIGIYALCLEPSIAVLLLLLPFTLIAILSWMVAEPLWSWVDLYPDRIVYRLGKHIRRVYPLDTIRLVFTTAESYYSQCCYRIILSTLPQSELVQRREEQLKKGPFSRNEYPFRKRVAGWEQAFMREYLQKCGRKPEFLTLWDDDTGWLLTLLRQLYPQLSVQEGVKYSKISLPAEANADRFPRLISITPVWVAVVCTLLLGSPLVVLLGSLDIWAGLWCILVFAAIAVLGGFLTRLENTLLEPTPEGIRYIRNNKQVYLFPAEKIATLAVVFLPQKYNEAAYVVAAPQSIEDLTAAAIAGVRPDSARQAEYAARLLLPEGSRQIAYRELARLVRLGETGKRSMVVACYSPMRLKKLKETYPQAQLLVPEGYL